MATSNIDKKQNQGPRAFFNKNFGKDEKGNSFVYNTAVAPFDFMSWYTRDPEFSAIPFILTLVVGLAATGVTDAVIDNYTDIDSAAYSMEEVVDSAVSQVYNYKGKYYLLRATDEGVQLYRRADIDESGTDDYYTLVPEHEAPAIARSIATTYKGIVEQQNGYVDIYSEFESVAADEPSIISYEGITGVFELNDGQYHVMGDNIQEETNKYWNATPQTAIDGQIAWEAALTDMAAGRYIEHAQTVEQAPTWNEINYPYWLIYAQIIGGVAGLGTAIGAGTSVVSSRRRFKRDNGLS